MVIFHTPVSLPGDMGIELLLVQASFGKGQELLARPSVWISDPL